MQNNGQNNEQTNNNQVLLIAMVPQSLKDDVVDSLIQLRFSSGFSLYKIQGFSREHSQFNLSEQVVGYQDLFRFEVAHDAEQSEALLSHLRTSCPHSAIRYWISPILQSGLL